MAGEAPAAAALRLARVKASSLTVADDERAIALAADTIVEQDGLALGKPRDDDDGRAMLRRLAGRTHQVHTGVCCLRLPDRRRVAALSTSIVTMMPLSDEEIEWYVATGEGRDKAGGYAVQGRAGLFVRSIDGSYSNVVGLPLQLVYGLLGELGGADLQRILRPPPLP